MATKLEGGGKTLSGRATKKYYFFAASLSTWTKSFCTRADFVGFSFKFLQILLHLIFNSIYKKTLHVGVFFQINFNQNLYLNLYILLQRGNIFLVFDSVLTTKLLSSLTPLLLLSRDPGAVS